MTNELTLLTQENFGGIELDLYRNENNEVFMTAKQLGEALEYANPVIAINKMVSRNERLKKEEFSVLTSLVSTDGKAYNTRLFTEDGLYELTMLSKQPKAEEFRDFIRKLLKGLRKGELQVTEAKVYSYMVDNPAKRARLWADEMDEMFAIIHEKEEENQQLTQVVEEVKPKAQAFERAMDAKNLHSMKEVAHLMGVGRNELFKYLREAKILNASNLPYQRYINSGYFEVKHSEKNGHFFNTTLATQKGMGWLVMNKDKIVTKGETKAFDFWEELK